MTYSEKLSLSLQREITDLTNSITDMIDNFRDLRRPLTESHDKVPQAANQLDKITEQTEAATHQMLDLVEGIVQRDDEIIKGLFDLGDKLSASPVAALMTDAENLAAAASANLNDAYTLMQSLQFQDITAQQMSHAASLLEDIEEKLRRILVDIGGQDALSELRVYSRKSNRAFDPHADFVERKADQQDIDNLFAADKKKATE